MTTDDYELLLEKQKVAYNRYESYTVLAGKARKIIDKIRCTKAALEQVKAKEPMDIKLVFGNKLAYMALETDTPEDRGWLIALIENQIQTLEGELLRINIDSNDTDNI